MLNKNTAIGDAPIRADPTMVQILKLSGIVSSQTDERLSRSAAAPSSIR
jgi:hypothetical protein